MNSCLDRNDSHNGVSVLFLYQRETTDTSNDSHLVVCQRNLVAATILPEWVAYRYLQPRCLGLDLGLGLSLSLALALVTEAGVEGETSLALALVTEGGNGPTECVVDVVQQVTVDWMSV